jgi:class 3 adenylate cyclase/tetratricopeptide (TPR) repeat protein
MTCPACGFENPAEMKFCGDCGAALDYRCPQCGADDPAGKKFCGDCGAEIRLLAARPLAVRRDTEPPTTNSVTANSLSPRSYTPRHLAEKILNSRSALEGERKQVTVLFADVKGSMELAEQLDPEEWHSILDRFFAILTEGVHRFEGTVNQYTGDGIMALFGAPIAHEDHAQRACHAALQVRDAVREYAKELRVRHGVPFGVRIGLNSGDVVVGRIGDDLRMDYTAQGLTVGLAQRMEARAESGHIVLSEHTARLVEGYFQLHALGRSKVKGASEPVGLFDLEGVSTSRTRFDVARVRGLTRFVGRGAEMDVLEAALARARAGNGQVIGVVAEAGTGKSRLCYEFAERCRAAGMRVIEGRCAAYGRNIPLLPILQIFRHYYGITEQDSDREARAKLAGRLLPLDEAYREVLPVLFEFFGVPDPDHPAPHIDPELKQRQLFGVLRKLVQRGAEDTVALIEDLHWIDGASAAWLEQWVDAIAGTRFVLLVNFRPEFEAPWVRRSYYQQLPLAPLSPEAVRHLLESLLGADPSTAGLADAIHARTGGNPFFTEEVVQSLIESGKLEGSAGDYRLTAPVETLDVPAGVHAVLAARIDRLAEREKQALQTAAVIGKEFSEPVLTQVLGNLAPRDAAAAEVAAALRTLTQAEFVYEQGLYPVAEYTFKHPLTQEVAYDTLLRERRARVHAAVARAAAEIYAEKLDEKSALLAHHCEQAGEARQAALWHKRAAEWAGVSNAPESLRHWERVRSLLRPLPHTSETLQLGVTACVGHLNLCWRLGTPMADAKDIFEEGRRLAKEAGDVRAQAALHGTYGCALGLVGGDSDDYVHYSREAIRLADETEDPGLQIAQRAYLGYASTFAGRLSQGLESCETACRTLPADPALGAEFTGYSPFLGILNTQAWILARLGRLDEATMVCDRAEHLALAHGDIEVLTWMQLARIEVDVVRDDAAAARRHANSALETGAKATTPQSLFVGPFALGIAHRLATAWAESIPMLEEALRFATSGSNRMFEGWVRAELSEAYLGGGELDRAEREAQAAVAVARAHHCRYDEARANLALAHTQLRRADARALARVEQALVRAQALVDETGAQTYQPELHECRAQLAQLRGDAPAARREFEAAHRLYAEMGAPAQVERLAKNFREWRR